MRVTIESPFKATDQYSVEENVEFARKVCRWSVKRGASPYASHLLFPQFLDDNTSQERLLGIGLGFDWTSLATEIWFCLREGESMSSGMIASKEGFAYTGVPMRLFYFTPDGEFLREGDFDANGS